MSAALVNGLLMLPALLLLAAVFLWPLLRYGWMSGHASSVLTGLQAIPNGGANWQRLLEDSRFWQDAAQTLRFAGVSVALELLLGLGLALLLHQPLRGRGVLRAAVLLPWALPTTVMVLGWRWIYNDPYGPLNRLIVQLGGTPYGFLSTPSTTWLFAVLADVWKTTPFVALLLLAGLQSIPAELREAMVLEGAGRWQILRRLTLPLLLPYLSLALLFRLAQALGVFDLIQVLTGGGPAGSTETLALYAYLQAMRFLDFGYSATLMMATFLLLLSLALGWLLLLRRAPMKNAMRALVLIWSLGPMLWQLRTSLLSPEDLVTPSVGATAARWTLENYRLILTSDLPFWRYLVNSSVVGALTTLFTLVLAVPCAYGLQRQKGALRWGVSVALVAAALFPTVLLFLALLELARQFDLANDLLALSLPYTALSLPLAVLLLRAAFADLPAELEDAARLEGLDLGQRLRHVLLPLLGPALASTGILVFLFSWNEYPIALTWISRADLLTVPTAMARIAGSSVYVVPYGALAAATVLGSVPLLALMLLFQRRIVAGLTQGAIKG